MATPYTRTPRRITIAGMGGGMMYACHPLLPIRTEGWDRMGHRRVREGRRPPGKRNCWRLNVRCSCSKRRRMLQRTNPESEKRHEGERRANTSHTATTGGLEESIKRATALRSTIGRSDNLVFELASVSLLPFVPNQESSTTSASRRQTSVALVCLR